MAASPVQIYVFGDQTYDIADILSNLVQTRNDPVLSDFLERSTTVLKRDLGSLSQEQRSRCPRFTKPSDLLPYWRAGRLNPALSQALTSLCQLGVFIHEHGSAGRPYPKPEDACLTGLCTGHIVAAAVSCASSTTELLPLAVETVAIAFRVGLTAWDLGARLAGSADEAYPSWTAALYGVTVDDVQGKIRHFAVNRSTALSPYISAHISQQQCSVSAPPGILQDFLEQQSLSRKVASRLSITAPYHAAHLYTSDDVESILAPLRVHERRQARSTIPVISSVTGSPIIPGSFDDVLRTAVDDCLCHSIRWDLLVDGGIASHIHSLGRTRVSVHSVAASGDKLRTAIESWRPSTNDSTPLTCVKDEPSSIPAAPSSTPAAKSKIAIIGISGRFPHASSMDTFWDVLAQGIDTHEIVPPSRWNARMHVNLTKQAKNVSGTGYGCWLHDADQFDARFFNMSPREAPQVDPAQRLALLTAAEALEQAGIVPGGTSSTQKDRVGVYFGSTSNDWMETNSAQNIDTYFIPGGNRAFIPGRINYHFKFSGPSYTIDTACSSSLAAIHMACNALWRGEVDTAIVGGTNVLTNPDMTCGLDRGHFLSRTGNCKTFDESADGYCRGEAVATAILKRLDDAIADKDPVQACILGIATNHSAEAESITRPHVGAQQALFEGLLAEVGVKASDISYCEMHGTGTQAGDAGETASVLDVLAPAKLSSARRSDQPLYIGAAKANVGHGESAAGITSLAKILLMLKHNTIPPHCGIKTRLNSKIPDLKPRNTFIANAAVPWPRPKDGVRRVLLNNFSAAGGNTALVLEDAPNLPATAHSDSGDTRTRHILTISAKTPVALEQNMKSMLAWLDTRNPDRTTIARLSYTTSARRMHYAHRVAATGGDAAEIRASLQQSLESKAGSTRSKSTPKFIFSFTGQGSHYAGLGADLYANFSGFRADIIRSDRLCVQLSLPSIRALFERPAESHSAATPTMLQLAFVCLQMALVNMWTSLGVAPSAVVGHSLGEYAALYAAGVLSQADALHLVGRRAELMQQHCQVGSHSMLAVRSTLAGIEELLGPAGGDYEVSCVNGQQSVVLGGTRQQMNAARPMLKKRGSSSTMLEVPYAFHTAQVDPILSSLDSLARSVSFKDPKIPLISPACGKVVHSAAELGPDFVIRHCRGSVNIFDALNAAKNEGILHEKMYGIEIGPALVVSKMVKEVAGPAFEAFTTCQRDGDVWRLVTDALDPFFCAGADIEWQQYHRDFPASHHVLELPAYGWDLKSYWLQYVHDWSLRKGDPPLRASSFKLESSSIHRVVEDTINSSSGGDLIVEADLSRPDLHPMVQGHKVYGVPLCTPSVYADIALSIGEYLKHTLDSGHGTLGVEVAEMNIQSALVANSDNKPQMLRTAVHFDARTLSALCTFSSIDASGKVTEQHSNCVIRLFDVDQVQRDFQATAPQVQARITSIRAQAGSTGSTFRFSKAMIYKMVGQLADFDPNYRALFEITLDNDELEATGKVCCKDVLKNGDFHTNPAYIDALSQLGGFVMNANEGVDLDKELFVNHGWKSLKLFEPINPETTYTTHVKMREGEDKLWMGDITILDGQRVVGMFGGVALQGVPKRLMEYIVNAASKKVSGSPRQAGAKTNISAAAPTVAKATTTTTTKTTVPSQPMPSSLVARAVEIISQESGIAVGDLTDDSRFDDIGIDSLLSLVISSRLRDELELEFESSLFLELSTVSKLKIYLRGLEPAPQAVTVVETVQQEELVPPIPVHQGSAEADWDKVREVIAEESGIAAPDLTTETAFSDIGIDSLLSLVIGSRLRDELELDLPDRLFVEFPTIGELKARITGASLSPDTSTASSSPKSSSTLQSSPKEPGGTPPSDFEPDASIDEVVRRGLERHDSVLGKMQATSTAIRPAWSIVLQGTPKRAKERLFLFPDGCGAATSYLRLPTVSESTAVIAFNSPFMKHPQDMPGHGLQAVLGSYIEALRRHQEHGPYHLGGWSAGGILAYATAQQLMAAGEEVATLTLIDSPPPNKGLDRLPRRFFDHCTQVGIFGSELTETTKVPAWLMPHFEATIELLHDYHAPPMPLSATGPRVNIIWAGECAFDGVKYAHMPGSTAEDRDTEGMKFLTEKRTDLGPGQWAELFPGRDVRVEVAEGEHHFSLLRDKGAERLTAFIRKAMGLVSHTS